MTDIYNRLLRLNIELEGALRVLSQRESDEAFEVALDKFASLSSLFDELKAERTKLPTPCQPSEEDKPDNTVVTESDAESVESPVEEEVAEAETSEEAPAATTSPDIIIPNVVGDIRKTMTLNDKFLFKRELFGGNEAELNDTLELLASMHSFDEATEYIYDDLQWDSENSTVKDFMDIIKSYFSNSSKA